MLLVIYPTCSTLCPLKSLFGLVFNLILFKLYTFFLVGIKFILLTFRTTKPIFLLIFLFLFLFMSISSALQYILCNVLSVYQVSLSSLKLKRKVNAILLNLAFQKFKGT